MTQPAPSDRTIARPIGGRYRITGLVASGGMGEVYAARDTVLERTVALKVLRGNLGGDADFVERFRREAQAAARLSHSAIVQVFDWGRDDGEAYMAMEFVDGQNLREILSARGRLDVATASRITWQVCEALEHAHKAGIVHRDIKPENILVTADGRVKVADFGLARALAESRATQAGMVLGTAAYLAPEQVQGQDVDHRADLYALGIVLFEMLTGKAPFVADTPAAVAYRRVNEDVPPPSLQAHGVLPALDAVVKKASARDPGDRYTTAAAMASALHDAVPGAASAGGLGIDVQHTTALPVQSQETIQIARKRPNIRKRRLIAVLAVLMLIATIPIALRATARVLVPPLAGKTQDQALKVLRGRDLQPTLVQRHDDRVATGQVISTEPPAGAKLKKGAAVTVFVSLGPASVTVPDVRNKAVADAIKELEAKGLKNQRIDQYHSTVKKDVVYDQEPTPSLVTKGSAVKIFVSKGPEMVPVPDARGKPRSDAESLLESKGFDVTVTLKEDDKVAEGLVISQSPASGSAAKGSVVALVVSKGAPPVVVPDLICMTRAQASDAAAQAGFRIQFEGRARDNIVVDQNPIPNSKAPRGSTITTVVGFGSRC